MNISEHYTVTYADITIGDLYISDENMYRFVPSGYIEEHKKLQMFIEWLEDTGWCLSIPFFQERIENFKRINPNQDVIGYHTDLYRLIRVRD